jgi:hypothetical protein
LFADRKKMITIPANAGKIILRNFFFMIKNFNLLKGLSNKVCFRYCKRLSVPMIFRYDRQGLFISYTDLAQFDLGWE